MDDRDYLVLSHVLGCQEERIWLSRSPAFIGGNTDISTFLFRRRVRYWTRNEGLWENNLV